MCKQYRFPTEYNIPKEILGYIDDFANTQEYWKRRFTNDILPEIDYGFKLVGFICVNHGTNECECDDSQFIWCQDCYCGGYVNCLECDKSQMDSISYYDFISLMEPYKEYPYLPPWETSKLKYAPRYILIPFASWMFHPEMPLEAFNYLSSEKLGDYCEFRKELNEVIKLRKFE